MLGYALKNYQQGEEFELIMQGKEVVANFKEIFIKLIELV